MLRFSTRVRYGLRILSAIARQPDGKSVSAEQIAREEGLTVSYVELLLFSLKKAGFVRGVKGAQGGYFPALPFNELNLFQVVSALGGEPELAPCVINPGKCPRSGSCQTRQVWVRSSQIIRDYMSGLTLAAISRETGKCCSKKRKAVSRRLKSSRSRKERTE
ncbi:MAG: Rrf2 family transcriptional regulator [Candidatus Wallbacteria bacterium]|nr:Rrf2 family transcriptional regulator [Candidatus Wallbacteria bacterium]